MATRSDWIALMIRSRIVWGMLSTMAKAFGGFLVIAAAIPRIGLVEIGFWYLCLGFSQLIMRLDFGFAQTITRDIVREAHEGGSGIRRSQRRSVHVLYAALAVVAVIVSCASSAYLLGYAHGPADWIAWGLGAAGTILSLIASGEAAVPMGNERIREVQQVQFVSAVAGAVVSLGMLWRDQGIASLGAGVFVSGAVSLLGAVFLSSTVAAGAAGEGRRFAEWLGGWWPSAWRTGVMGIGAFLLYFSCTFLAARFLSLEDAGRFGFTFSMMTLLMTLCAIPVSIAAPSLTRAWAEGPSIAVWREFARRRMLSLGLYALAAIFLSVAGNHLLGMLGSDRALLDTPKLVVLEVIFALELNHSLYAQFAMSAEHVPFAVPAILSGIAVAIIGWLGVNLAGAWGLVLSLGIVQVAWNNWYPVWYCHRRLPSAS